MHARPMLVNGRCPVLAGHCVRSNGGLWYTNYGEFREALKALLADPALRTTLGAQGRAYVQSRYRWDVVEKVYVEAIERVMAETRDLSAQPPP
jgi:glycosyltransferase involved in cell wall biosynthesis